MLPSTFKYRYFIKASGETSGKRFIGKGSMRIKVARITISGTYGGIGSLFRTLAERYDETRFDLHVIYLASGGPNGDYIQELGVPVHVLNCNASDLGKLSFGAIKRLRSILKEIEPDVIHSTLGTSNYICAIASLGLRTRPYRIFEEVSVAPQRLLSRAKFSIAYRLAHRISVVSLATKKFIVQNSLAPERRIVVIPNSYPPSFDALPLPRPKEHSPHFTIAMVSRISAEKNHAFILRVVQRVIRETCAPVRLVIVGDGALRSELSEFANELGIGENVDFLGFREDVPDILTSSDLYLLPSTNESFGIALAEAMRCGIPVIGSNAGGIPEVMDGYPPGYTLSPDDEDAWIAAILRVIEMSPEERSQLGQVGRAIAISRFSPEAYVRALQDEYSQSSQHTSNTVTP